MFNIIVAEDEPWIRSGIVEMIHQIGKGFLVIGEAVNGEEAWQQLNELWPTILITDIVMPRKDGLWLVQQIYEHMLPVIPIIISGYDKFEYAQQAIRYNVSDFLLKPFAEKQLHQALDSAVKRLDTIRPIHDYMIKVQQFIDEMESSDIPQLVEKLSSLVHDIYYAKQANKKARVSLLRILSGKMNELMPNQRVEPETDTVFSNLESCRAYFIALAETWAKTQTTRSKEEMKYAVQKVCSHIAANYMKNLNVGDMAQYVNLSVSYFRHLFKSYTGKNFTLYLNHIRIEKAKLLLLEDDLKVYEVSEMTGFVSQPYFNRIFKEITGLTPIEYRRQMR